MYWVTEEQELLKSSFYDHCNNGYYTLTIVTIGERW